MRKYRRQLLTYLLSDYLCLNIGWLVYTLIRYAALSAVTRETYTLWQHLGSLPVVGGQLIIPLMMVGLYWLSGYYNNLFFKSRVDDIGNSALISLIGTVIIFFMVMINDMDVSRMKLYEMVTLMWLCLFLPVVTVRLVITTRANQRIRNGQISFNTLIIGTGCNARNMAERLNRSAYSSEFRVVGFVDAAHISRTDSDINGLPVYNYDNLVQVIRDNDVRRVIVMPQHTGMRHTGQLINDLFATGCTIYISPELYEVMVTRPRMRNVAGEPLIDISHVGTSAFTVNAKRLSDVCISAVTLLVLSPLYLALAIAVKRSSPGPVIYRQERIGHHKKPFFILKFRTMYTDAENDGPALSSLDDPRITPIGHIMRKYRLDELPQFWNVLKGDMSLVGPRPEREYYIRQIVERAPYYNLIHQVRPGITSWGMVKYGYATNVDQMIERLRYDMIYIDNVSLPVDLKILFYTINTVITGKGL